MLAIVYLGGNKHAVGVDINYIKNPNSIQVKLFISILLMPARLVNLNL